MKFTALCKNLEPPPICLHFARKIGGAVLYWIMCKQGYEYKSKAKSV